MDQLECEYCKGRFAYCFFQINPHPTPTGPSRYVTQNPRAKRMKCEFCKDNQEDYRLDHILSKDMDPAPICKKCYHKLPKALSKTSSKYIIQSLGGKWE